MRALLSVIVPVYNAGPYLKPCIESILNQTVREIELLLIDDGSTDESGSVCEHYARLDSRIRVFHQKNQGPIAARKKGLEESQCGYVTFVDADDFIAVDSYRYAVPSMKAGVDMILFGITRYLNENDQRMEYPHFHEGMYQRKEIEEQIYPRILWDCEQNRFGLDPSLCNKVIKKEKLLSNYPDLKYSEIQYGEDVIVIYPMMEQIETLEVKKQSYYYHRQRQGMEIPGYIKDAAYFDKLYRLYGYLRERFAGDTGLLRQLEYFYMYSAALKKRCYRDLARPVDHLFPFDKVAKGEKIVLYGAGAVGQSYRAQLRKIAYCTVVLWVDRNFQAYKELGVVSPTAVKTAVFDRLVIAIDRADVKREAALWLSELGIETEKLV